MSGRAAVTGLIRWDNWGRTLAIALVAGVFMSLAGAFETEEATLPVRLVYWSFLMVVGTLWGFTVMGLMRRRLLFQNIWLNAATVSVLMAIPFTVVVWAVSCLAFRRGFELAYLPGHFVPVLVICAVMTFINVLADPPLLRAPDEGVAAPPSPPRFLERLPLRLRGAELWAVESEDHYLRLHTSKGQDLILMRLADAIAELEGLEGAQTHRSWWVARDAIVDARRGDGRAILKLKDDTEVPVSRTFAGELRSKGWF